MVTSARSDIASMETRVLSLLYLVISLSVTRGNECLFPASWQRTWMTGAVEKTKDVALINYNIDSSCSTAISTAPLVTIKQYNCPAYSRQADGIQVYLRAELGKQYADNGLCVEQRQIGGLLLRREAGVQSTIDSCKAALNSVNLYSVILPVDPYKADDVLLSYTTTWSVSTEVSCPMPGTHLVACQLGASDLCPQGSGVAILGSVMSIFIPGFITTYPNLPLSGTIKCLADLSARDLGESETNDRVLIVKRGTNYQPNRVHFYCVRYKQLSDGTWSLSFDVENTNRPECLRSARHDWQGRHGTPPREYFKLLLRPQTGSSTKGNVRTTSMPTTSPATPALYHLQTMIGGSHDEYAGNDEKAATLKSDLKTTLAQICNLNPQSIKNVHNEPGKGGEIMTTFDVMITKTTAEACEQKLKKSIVQAKAVIHGKVALPLKNDVYMWRGDSKCPYTICSAGSSCWIRQGDYTCECSGSSQDDQGVCSKSGIVEETSSSSKRIVTYTLIGIAAVLVITAIIVIILVVIRRRSEGKDVSSEADSIGSLEQQDRDMYSSIGKKPTAYHDKQFIVTDEDEYTGEKTGIQNSGYK